MGSPRKVSLRGDCTKIPKQNKPCFFGQTATPIPSVSCLSPRQVS